MNFYCMSPKIELWYYVKYFQYYPISKNGMQYSAIGRTESPGSQAQKKVLPDFHLYQYGIVQNGITTLWTSGIIF